MGQIFEDEFGFEVDEYGRDLDTPHNRKLEAYYRELELEQQQQANTRINYDSRFSSSSVNRGGVSYPKANARPARHPSFAQQDDYPIQTHYPRKTPNNGGNIPTRKELFDLDNDNTVKSVNTDVYISDEEHEEYLRANKKPAEKQSKKILKPVDGVYHDTLLPAGYVQTKIFLGGSTSDGNADSIQFSYFKREIMKKGEELGMEKNFGEGFFNSGSGFTPLSIEVANIIDLTPKDKSIITIENGEDIIDSILYLLASEPSTDVSKGEIYIADSYIATKYFNNTGRNLFMELSKATLTSPMELIKTLSEIYTRYEENAYTRNAILKIDSFLIHALNSYLAAYSGEQRFKVYSIEYLSEFYDAISTKISDSDLRKNMLIAVNSFLTNLIYGIKEFYSPDTQEAKTELFCPTKELITVTTNTNILKELGVISKENAGDNLFYLIDRTYTPYMHDMVSRIDKDKVMQKYNRTILFTFDNIYTIIKAASGSFYISNYQHMVTKKPVAETNKK